MDLAPLVNALHGTTLAHAGARREAEAQLEAMARVGGYGAALAQVVVDDASQVPIPLRQLAGLVLARHVKRHWATLPGDPDPTLVVVGEQEKAQVRLLIPRGLQAPHSKLRTATALCIAALAALDFPAHWPTLLQDLVSCLGSPNGNLVHGAIKTLDMLASSQMADDQVPLFLHTVFPALHGLFSSPQVDDGLKSRAASIVSSVVRWLGIICENNPKPVKSAVDQSLKLWMEGFVAVLQKPDSPTSSGLLKLRVVGIVTQYASFFPKQFAPYASVTAQHVWANLRHDVGLYEHSVCLSDDGDTTGQDSDGNTVGFEPLVASYVDFVHALSTKKSYRDILKSSYASLVGVLLHYMQMTVVQREQYADDPNEYLSAEDEEVGRFSIRHSCVELMQTLASTFKRAFLKTLLDGVTHALRESQAKFTAQDPSWWLLREAAVYALGSVMPDLRRLDNMAELFNVAAFFDAVVLPDVANAGVPELRGRAMWFAGHAVQGAAPEVQQRCVPVVKCAIQMLCNPAERLPVKMAACQGVADIATVFRHHNIHEITPAVGPAVRGCCELFPVCSDETIHTVVEILLELLTAHCQADYVPFVMQNLIAVWKKYSSDQFSMQLVVEVVECVCRSPDCVPLVNQALLPVIVSVYSSSPPPEAHVLDNATSLLAICSRSTPNAMTAPGFSSLFQTLVHLADSTTNASLLQSASLALIGYVQSASLSEAHLSSLLAVVRKLLSPQLPDEDAAAHVGKLVLKIILHAGNVLGSVTPQILGAVLNRLANAKTRDLIETLVLVFARLILLDVRSTMEFLSTAKLGDGSVALPFVMRTWVDNQPHFSGSYQRKVTVLALVALLKLQNAQLNNLPVRGHEIAQSGRQTRSRGPLKYSETTLQLRMLTLLVAQFLELACGDDDLSDEGSDAYSSEEDGDGAYDDAESSFSKQLGEILRGAGGSDEDEDMDPVFADDPLSKVDLLATLRGVLVALWQANQAAFEAMIGQCEPGDREVFVKLWPKQVALQQSPGKK